MLAFSSCHLLPCLPAPCSCLTWFLEEVKDDAQVHDAFATLLESCEM